jgi:hypothetical protein
MKTIAKMSVVKEEPLEDGDAIQAKILALCESMPEVFCINTFHVFDLRDCQS